MKAAGPVLAAGAVVWRTGNSGIEVVLIHRPKYDDWSLPKGKLDLGEHLVAAAVREVAEETGLRVQLGSPVGVHAYPVADAVKEVHYWSARALCGGDVTSYRANREVDDVQWLPLTTARRQLTHARDAEMLERFADSDFRARPLVVLRHGHARSRASWTRPDIERPLNAAGRRQAAALVPVLRAYGVQRVLTSDAVRCVETVQPFSDQAGTALECHHVLSEDGSTAGQAERLVHGVLEGTDRAVLCSHRPVLPKLFAAAGVDDPQLRPGEFVVLYRRDGAVKAAERHAV